MIYPYSHLSSYLAPPKYAFEIIKELEIDSRKIINEVYIFSFGWTKSSSDKNKGHRLSENFKVISDKQITSEGNDEIFQKEDSKQHIIDTGPVYLL